MDGKEEKKMKGYDMDGVLCSFVIEDLQNCKSIEEEMIYYKNQTPIYKQLLTSKVIVVSGRRVGMEEMSKKWLEENYDGVEFEVICVGYDSESEVRKVKVMREKGIVEFVDDNEKWVRYFRSEGIVCELYKEVKVKEGVRKD